MSYFSLFQGPGPVGTPVVSVLHPRNVTVTWVPPSKPNGVITNYTVCLCPSSICSTRMTPSFVLGPNPSLWPHTEGAADLNSSLNNPISSPISMSTLNTGSNDSSSTIQSTKHNFHSNPSSSLRPNIREDIHRTNTSQGSGFISFNLTEPTAANVNPSPSLLLSDTQHAASSDTEPLLGKSLPYGPISGCSSTASDSSSYPRSVTVPGNTTSYAFLSLLPYQSYILQVQYNVVMLL